MKTILAKDLSPMETNAWLCGGITPRPIAFVSTINSEGSRNLAPFSFLMPLVAIRQLLPLPLTDGERREPQGYLSKY